MAHIDTCESCRLFLERDRCVQTLVAFKRYEKQDPVSAQRILAGVREGVRTRQQRGLPLKDLVFGGFTHPAIRYGLAFTLLAVLGLHILIARQSVTIDPAMQYELLYSQRTGNTPTNRPGSPAIRLDSEFINYGPLNTLPVDFEF